MRRTIYMAILLFCCSGPLHAASWSQCKSQKIQLVRLQQHLGAGKKLAGYSSGADMKRARRAKQTWLRKNCRYYSRQLRNIERGMM